MENSSKNFIPAPFDGKHLCDDYLKDTLFTSLYECEDSKGNKTHLIGNVSAYKGDICLDGVIDVVWSSKSNIINIKLVGCPCQADFYGMTEDFFKYYEGEFKSWENPDNENLVVRFTRHENGLDVCFYFEVD